MKKILPLPQHIVSKIAAGEVIERPAYAVKELIENAIDAQADYITIHIEESGLKKIIVSDNGVGMNKEDLVEATKPHTTSKLYKEEELTHISTLGFRGEALASIAIISTLTVRSRVPSENTGMEIVIKNDVIQRVSPVGLPVGTTIIVEQLFHTIPVRKKFLKSQSKEFRYITDIVTQYGLSFPNIRFFLVHNKKIILDLPANQSLEKRLQTLLGNDLFTQLIPITYTDAYLSIQGFLSKPQLTTTTQSKQFLFVNNRTIRDKRIAAAIKEMYGNLVEPAAYPIFILFLTLPFERVDVNIHPRKEQVKFMLMDTILDTLRQTVRDQLEMHNITSKKIRWEHDPLYDQITRKIFSPRKGLTNSYAGNILKDSPKPWDLTPAKLKTETIEQLHNLYILVESSDGFILIDQHAAHERILFEQFTKEFLRQKKYSLQYRLPTSEIIEIPASDYQIVLESTEEFSNLGFTIEPFKGNCILLSAVPMLFRDRDNKKILLEIIDDLSEEKTTKIDRQSTKMLTYLACRGAIKAGDKMTKRQIKELIEKLETTPNNASCPHGRPTKILVQLSELHRLFKRS